MNSGISAMPAKKPPTCPHHATPPPAAWCSDAWPDQSWMTNHTPSTTNAGTSITVTNTTRNTKVLTRPHGQVTAYAPSTAAMAPLRR